MKISEDIRSVSYLKTHTIDVLHQVNETHRPVIITQNDQPAAVIQDAKSYEKMVNSFAILQMLSKREREIQKGKTIHAEKVFARIEKKLKKRLQEK